MRNFLSGRAACALFSALALGVIASPPAVSQQSSGKTSGGDRIARIEAQLVDLQVAIGSLESLVSSGAGPAAPPQPAPSAYEASEGASDTRVAALETQIQALTAQLEQVTAQMAALQSRLGGAGDAQAPMPGYGGDAPARLTPNSYTPPRPQAEKGGQSGFDHQAAFGPVGSGDAAVSQAGVATDPIATFLADSNESAGDPAVGSALAGQPPKNLAALSPERLDPSGASPKEIYDIAYRSLMAQEYDSAEESFKTFVSSFPENPLAGEAQYWLGESYYVRGQHKEAADAFLAAYRRYGKSRKAPDSLLKLALSLAQLKQKDAACSALNEFDTRYPSAAEHLRDRAASEQQRVGC